MTRFAVIVPSRNRVSLCAEALESIGEQDHPPLSVVVVRLSDELVVSEEGPGDPDMRPEVATTFDDGYLDAVGAGVDELSQFDTPDTFFVVPGLAGLPGIWWDRLAERERGNLSVPLRSEALMECRGRQREVLSSARTGGTSLPEALEHACPGSEAELHGLGRRSGIRLGCHTWSHPNLTRLSEEEQFTEVAFRWIILPTWRSPVRTFPRD